MAKTEDALKILKQMTELIFMVLEPMRQYPTQND